MSQKGHGVVYYRDGRERCLKDREGREEYRRRAVIMHERQNHQCCLCGDPLLLAEATFEHGYGRGVGGSKRDDRVELVGEYNGEPYYVNGVAHFFCNVDKGSMQRVAYLEKRGRLFLLNSFRPSGKQGSGVTSEPPMSAGNGQDAPMPVATEESGNEEA